MRPSELLKLRGVDPQVSVAQIRSAIRKLTTVSFSPRHPGCDDHNDFEFQAAYLARQAGIFSTTPPSTDVAPPNRRRPALQVRLHAILTSDDSGDPATGPTVTPADITAM